MLLLQAPAAEIALDPMCGGGSIGCELAAGWAGKRSMWRVQWRLNLTICSFVQTVLEALISLSGKRYLGCLDASAVLQYTCGGAVLQL
jgi:hypothetical protein